MTYRWPSGPKTGVPGHVEIRLDASDALAADNSVRALLRPADEIRVALTGVPNPFVERVLESLPYVDLHRPQDLSAGGWDLVICDRALPADLPDTNLLVIAPDRDLDC